MLKSDACAYKAAACKFNRKGELSERNIESNRKRVEMTQSKGRASKRKARDAL